MTLISLTDDKWSLIRFLLEIFPHHNLNPSVKVYTVTKNGLWIVPTSAPLEVKHHFLLLFSNMFLSDPFPEDQLHWGDNNSVTLSVKKGMKSE